MDPVLYSIDDVSEVAPLPLLGALGSTDPEGLASGKRRALIAFSCTALLLLVALCGVLTLELVRNSGVTI
jgi:hypothetical protein